MGGMGIASKLFGGNKKKVVYRDRPDTQTYTSGSQSGAMPSSPMTGAV